jgi:predicted amidophosphoribosyltransferase
MQWKEDRRIKKEAEQQKKKADEEKKNKNKGQLRTGRELFTYDPTLFVDD